jgi:hypothetical protein
MCRYRLSLCVSLSVSLSPSLSLSLSLSLRAFVCVCAWAYAGAASDVALSTGHRCFSAVACLVAYLVSAGVGCAGGGACQ